MSQELGSLLKNAFLSRKTGSRSTDQSKTKLVPGERRDVAVLFLDLAGFTAFSQMLDHETVHQITTSLMDELVFTAEQYSGYVDKIEGDRIMVLFGAVRSSENNSRSAILCGFKMLEVVKMASSILSEANVNLTARIGINSGPVTVAPDAIGHLTAMGNTVNIASRVEEKAAENSILVTDRVYSLCSENILWGDSREISVRGIGVPLKSWKPVSVNFRGNRISFRESVNTVFVARENEYLLLKSISGKQLTTASGQNRMGGARHLIVELTGEAGTGKTRLVTEFLTNEYKKNKAMVLRGNSIADAQPAYWLWSVLLLNLLNLQNKTDISYTEFKAALTQHCPLSKLSKSAPFLARLVSAFSDDSRLHELSNKALATETKLALRDLLATLSENKPVIVVLEDLHWIDSTDSEALDFIVNNCNSVHPILFLLLRRSDHKNPLPESLSKTSDYALYKNIELVELNKSEIQLFAEEFIEKLSGRKTDSISPAAIEFISRHSSGNPFFLQELILHLVDSEGLSLSDSSSVSTWSLSDDSVELSTPGSLTGLLQSRLDRLPDPLRKVLLNCSVLGSEFRSDVYTLVEKKLDIESDDLSVFNELVERQFLESSSAAGHNNFRFRHSFIQNTAYRSLLAHNLKLLHKATAESMEEVFAHEAERVSGKLADHWDKAGVPDSAIKWGLIAHKHASANYQYPLVLKWGDKLDNWLSASSEERRSVENLLTVLDRNSFALQYLSRWEKLSALLNRMQNIASSNDMHKWLARTELLMGSYFTAIREIDNALSHLEKAFNLSKENGFAEIESEALCSLGVIAGMKRDVSRAREYFERARDLFSGLKNSKGKAKALGNLGILSRNIGETDKAILLLEEVLDIFREIGDVRSEAVTLGNLGSLYEDRSDIDKAESHFRGAIEIFHRLGGRMPEAIFLCNLGNVLRGSKLLAEARKSYSEAIEITMEIGDRRTMAWVMTNLGLACIIEGSLDESEKLYNKALHIFGDIADEENQAIAVSGLGYLQYLSGKKDAALKSYLRANEIISRMKLPPMEFRETFSKLHKELKSDNLSSDHIPWPDHW